MTIILLLVKRQLCLQQQNIKIEIIYSLVNPCGKSKHRYPINKKTTKRKTKEKKRNTGDQQRDNHPIHCTRLQKDKKLYPNDLYNKHG